MKEGTKEWNYYSDEDIEIDVVEKKDDIYSFIVYGCNVSDEAISTDIELQIKAKKFYIFNPVEIEILMP